MKVVAIETLSKTASTATFVKRFCSVKEIPNFSNVSKSSGSIQLGVTRLLCKMNPENRPVLKPFGFLTRDARIKERKKYGLRKARKAPQYSKR